MVSDKYRKNEKKNIHSLYKKVLRRYTYKKLGTKALAANLMKK